MGISFPTDQLGWACKWDHLLKTTDGGTTWSDAVRPDDIFVRDVEFVDAMNGWLVGSSNTICRTTDGGATWTASHPGTYDWWEWDKVEYVDASHVYARFGAAVATSTDGGATWGLGMMPSGNSITDLAFADATHGWAVDEYRNLARTVNGGASWSYTAAWNITGIGFADAQTGLRSGWGGVEGTTDGGDTWTPLASAEDTPYFSDIVMTDADHAWAICGYGDSPIWATDDGGQTWFAQSVESDDWAGVREIIVRGSRGWACGGSIWTTARAGGSDMRPPVTTFDVPEYINATTTISLAATDDGPDLPSTFYRFDDGVWQSGTAAVLQAPPDHSQDGTHMLEVSSVDSAGNDEVGNKAHYLVDTIIPTLTITPQEEGMVDTWRNSEARIDLGGYDSGSGLDRIEVGMDTVVHWVPLVLDYNDKATVGVNAPADHSNDGIHTVNVRSVDKAGNVNLNTSTQVAIDTRKPTAAAPYPCSGTKGSYFTVKFKVTDKQPCSGYCAVLIRIWTKSGRLVKVVAPNKWFRANVVRSYRFKCGLARGAYRFTVKAADGAANLSTNRAANSFTVR